MAIGLEACQKTGTYLHMWWEQELIYKCWQLTFRETNEMRNLTLAIWPKIVFLSVFGRDIAKWTRRELISNLLRAPRLIIARKCRSAHNLSLSD